MDVDRGYYPRNAFIDRRFNPRAAAMVFTRLNARLSALGPLSVEAVDERSLGVLRFHADGQSFELHCGATSEVADRLAACASGDGGVNLLSGHEASADGLLSTFDEPPANDESDIQVVLLHK
jgi:hypothetical protein